MTDVFSAVLGMSIAASMAAAAVMLLRLLLRKAPKAVCCLLWAAVFFRLLCPVTPAAAFGVLPSRSAAFVQTRTQAAPVLHLPIPELPAHPVPADVRSTFLRAASVVWLCGAAMVLCTAVYGDLRLGRRLRTAVRRRDNVYETDRISTSFVRGLLRPRIYLPAGLPEKTAEMVILHEQSHIRRLDHVLKPLAFLALCAHWFNPIVWLSYYFLGCDMEMACDEAVVQSCADGAASGYASALLELSSRESGLPFALQFSEGSVRERIRRVLGYQKPGFTIRLAAVLAVIAVTAGCAVSRPAALPASASAGSAAAGGSSPAASSALASGSQSSLSYADAIPGAVSAPASTASQSGSASGQPWSGLAKKTDRPRQDDMNFARIYLGSDRKRVVNRMGQEPDADETPADGSEKMTYFTPNSGELGSFPINAIFYLNGARVYRIDAFGDCEMNPREYPKPTLANLLDAYGAPDRAEKVGGSSVPGDDDTYILWYHQFDDPTSLMWFEVRGGELTLREGILKAS
jgi:beta-lactamase regulating signal transducer with metallopeptidase domain